MKNKLVIFFAGMLLLCACDQTDTQTLQIANNGRELYTKHCANCHQEDGSGLARLIPPLKDADFISRFPQRLPCVVRNGMDEQVEVNSNMYQLKMPANAKLSDKEIYYITSYVLFKFAGDKQLIPQDSVAAYLESCK